MESISSGNLTVSANGRVDSLRLPHARGALQVGFRNDEYGGPAWYGSWDGKRQQVNLRRVEGETLSFAGRQGGVEFTLGYRMDGDCLAIKAGMANHGATPFVPERVGLKLGLDTYMESFKAWDQKFFPTLLRCETTHFWGYAMSPLGAILGIASPDPIASWSLDYNRLNEDHNGHRIYTFNLDFLNALPLPERHPQQLTRLEPGERKEWTVFLKPIHGLDDVQRVMAGLCQAPMIQLNKHTLTKDETLRVNVYSQEPCQLTVSTPSGRERSYGLTKGTEGFWSCTLQERDEEYGVYRITVVSSNGRTGEARYYRRKPWSWYLKQARVEAINKPQKGTTHLESWYGHFSTFLARKHFPDSQLDPVAEGNFRRIFPLMFDVDTGEPITEPGRICNSAVAVSMLTDAYEATGDVRDLELAVKIADLIISDQLEDGSYRAYRHHPTWAGGPVLKEGLHYTSVYYIAKSILELAAAEKARGRSEAIWKERYDRHFSSAQSAIANLEKLKDNIGTEGEHTFEDGMISCTSLQLGLNALLQDDPDERKKFTDAALLVLEKHRCLEQLVVPDCRMRGCTIRFWESQYDVLMDRNMINSPHGWSSWKTYATWYLYLLTGEEHWLADTMDTLGSCMQMIDVQTGNLRWAFICDPSVQTGLWEQDEDRPGKGKRTQGVIGEQYVDMISGWWKTPVGQLSGGYLSMTLRTRDGVVPTDNQGGCCDNDVHEHFKCLEEVALTSSYVIERETGEIVSWNCSAVREGGVLHVYPHESIVHAVHANLVQPKDVAIHYADQVKEVRAGRGMRWIRTGLAGEGGGE